MTPEPDTPTFEYALLPPKGWTDIGEPFFYRSTCELGQVLSKRKIDHELRH